MRLSLNPLVLVAVPVHQQPFLHSNLSFVTTNMKLKTLSTEICGNCSCYLLTKFVEKLYMYIRDLSNVNRSVNIQLLTIQMKTIWK